MAKTNAANARIKRDYFQYLKEAKRRDEASIDAVAKALARFEESNGHKDFKNFHREQAVAFKRKLDAQTAVRTGKPLSRATVNSTLSALRAFFLWLAGQPGYKKKITYADADYFNLAEKDVRIARAVRVKAFPSLEQVHRVLSIMPAETDIELRNRALVAFALLTGARDGALASFRLKHVDLVQGRVDQDARDVRTKASKTFATWFFPVGGGALQIVQDWCEYLRATLLWGDDDPLFPPTQIGLGGNGGFVPVGLRRGECWQSAGPIREIFRNAFATAGLPYFNPHSLRDTLVQLGEQVCTTPEQFKAWSQNLGHAKVMTTQQAHRYAAATDEDVERWEAYEAFMHQRAVEKLLGIKKPIPEPWVIKKPKVETARPVPQPKAKDRKAVSWREVVDAVAQWSSVDPAMIIAPDTKGTRCDQFVRARHIVMLILHLRGNGYAQIGRWIGGRDHTTVIYAVRKMKRKANSQEMDLVSRLAGVSC